MADWPYSTTNWQRLRTAHLQRYPLCEGCEAYGRTKPANTVDHRIPISAGGDAFPGHDGLASYCQPCHSRKTMRGPEAGAARSFKPMSGCNADGSPIDKRHPWLDNDPLSGTARLSRPATLRPAVSPVTIIFGPPGSGKSYHVKANASPADQVLDLDEIAARLSGLPIYQTGREWVKPALRYRNARLQELANVRIDSMTWLIVTGPTALERDWWRNALRPVSAGLLLPSREVALARIAKDERRAHDQARMRRICLQWYGRFTTSPLDHIITDQPLRSEKRNEALRKSLKADALGPSPPHNFELIMENSVPVFGNHEGDSFRKSEGVRQWV